MAGFAKELLLAKAFVKLLNPKRLPNKKETLLYKNFLLSILLFVSSQWG
jgi:hypothetical protein